MCVATNRWLQRALSMAWLRQKPDQAGGELPRVPSGLKSRKGRGRAAGRAGPARRPRPDKAGGGAQDPMPVRSPPRSPGPPMAGGERELRGPRAGPPEPPERTPKERLAFLSGNEALWAVYLRPARGRLRRHVHGHHVRRPGAAGGGAGVLPALLRFLCSPDVTTRRHTAEKHAVLALDAHRVDFQKSVQAHHAFLRPTRARLFQELQPAGPCLQNTGKNTADAVPGEGFTDLDLDSLVAALGPDTLGTGRYACSAS